MLIEDHIIKLTMWWQGAQKLRNDRPGGAGAPPVRFATSNTAFDLPIYISISLFFLPSITTPRYTWTWKPIGCMLQTLFRGWKQHQIVHNNQRVDPVACNSDTIVNLDVTFYPIHIDYEEQWWKHTHLSKFNIHCEWLWFNIDNRDTSLWVGTQWLFTASKQQLSAINTVLPQHATAFLEGLRHMLSRSRQNRRTHFWHALKIYRKFVAKRKFAYSATSNTKIVLDILRLWSGASRVVSVRINKEQMKLDVLWTASTPLLRPLSILETLDTRTI